MPPSPGPRITAVDAADQFIAAHRLAAALLPPPRLRALLAAADGSPARALALPATELRRQPIALTEKQAVRVTEAADAPLSFRLLDQAGALGVSVITHSDSDYPANLLPFDDAPPLLFVRGALRPDDTFSVAIVGSRRAMLYGRNQAIQFARAFAERRLVVVSGGAAGIDTAAHRGALDVGGRTIAVLGCGVDVSYPAENRSLFAQIVERGGAVISEFPLGTTPEPWRFPARNRIIAGMTRGTVVVESPKDSGALITARNALDYGREVWAIPGPVDSGRSRGCHQLIQDGAGLADSPNDVLAALGLPIDSAAPHPKAVMDDAATPAESRQVALSPPPKSAVNLTPDEERLVAQFDLTPRHLDDASAAAGLSASQATVAATMLEMKGLVRRQPGNLFARVL
jgi:DNA processing protein